jgi:hypothetical protein
MRGVHGLGVRSSGGGFVVLLVVGSITGNLKMKSCCRIADPRCDLLMRDAFPDGAYPSSPPSHSMVDTPS